MRFTSESLWVVLVAVTSSAWASAASWPPAHAQATVLQVGQQSYLTKFSKHMETVRLFAAAQGFRYTVKVLDEADTRKGRAAAGGCVYTAKVLAISEALSALPIGDWIIFIDLDVQYATCDHGLFPRLMPSDDAEGGLCHLVAQDSSHSVNTGFLAARNSPDGASLVASWLAEQVTLSLATETRK
jgi:hypothetical protein